MVFFCCGIVFCVGVCLGVGGVWGGGGGGGGDPVIIRQNSVQLQLQLPTGTELGKKYQK